jgi:hypothetical protein
MGKASSSYCAEVQVKRVNVTDLTLCQKRRVLVSCLSQGALSVLTKSGR